jgi:uncharacterized repeat protein (TIGR03803 family)
VVVFAKPKSLTIGKGFIVVHRVLLPVALFALIIAPHAVVAQTETVLYDFANSPDGANPTSSLTSDAAGNLYGTTALGGATNQGTVFELSPDGDGGWNESVLYTFQGGTDGANPYLAALIFDNAGNLYGATQNGGLDGGTGTVFELSPVAGGWTEAVLYSFGYREGICGAPVGLMMDRAGNLYGATTGVSGYCKGVVFELSPSPGGTWTETTIGCCFYEVDAVPTLAMDVAGNIFGLFWNEVFELTPNGNGGWSFEVIYTFDFFGEGNYAMGPPVLDSYGNLYGTTTFGGPKNLGTVFRLTRGKQRWRKKILYSFRGGNHGSYPSAGVVLDGAGNIYGTTYEGGKYGFGTTFELLASGEKGGYRESPPWSFNGTDGAYPGASMILQSGKLYGTTQYGGPNGGLGNGVVFQMTP